MHQFQQGFSFCTRVAQCACCCAAMRPVDSSQPRATACSHMYAAHGTASCPPTQPTHHTLLPHPKYARVCVTSTSKQRRCTHRAPSECKSPAWHVSLTLCCVAWSLQQLLVPAPFPVPFSTASTRHCGPQAARSCSTNASSGRMLSAATATGSNPQNYASSLLKSSSSTSTYFQPSGSVVARILVPIPGTGPAGQQQQQRQ